ncbi:ABC transporter ATP-binding protein [Cryobacterium fucosi]|uniref:ABC transporter ATP-binding protein n=1 Tax=Cryobacterium fucosi TaxID=1259157 RepID=A0A4R9B4U1_9MICO|nr:ABC transporter ATP-binding protein [Cryobacterium fucosi]TFD75667.1 ABC transporter ATP-binding protein [Cryobacterium fucosi]
MSAVLAVTDLQIAFGGVKAVDGLSFSVQEREIIAVIGPNGAGKTSAFNCITGFYKPTAGAVILGGKDITGKRPADIAAAGISRTFQNLRLFPDLTVLDNVRAGMHLYGGQNWADAIFHTPRFTRSEGAYTAEAHHWLDFVGYEGARGVPIRNLSYGQQKQVEIARALARKSGLLLLDEPAAGLNYAEKQGLLSLCRRIRDLGTAIVLIEHDMGLVMKLSERIVVMNFGRAIAEGTPAEVKLNQAVIEAYLGKDDEEVASHGDA